MHRHALLVIAALTSGCGLLDEPLPLAGARLAEADELVSFAVAGDAVYWIDAARPRHLAWALVTGPLDGAPDGAVELDSQILALRGTPGRVVYQTIAGGIGSATIAGAGEPWTTVPPGAPWDAGADLVVWLDGGEVVIAEPGLIPERSAPGCEGDCVAIATDGAQVVVRDEAGMLHTALLGALDWRSSDAGAMGNDVALLAHRGGAAWTVPLTDDAAHAVIIDDTSVGTVSAGAAVLTAHGRHYFWLDDAGRTLVDHALGSGERREIALPFVARGLAASERAIVAWVELDARGGQALLKVDRGDFDRAAREQDAAVGLSADELRFGSSRVGTDVRHIVALTNLGDRPAPIELDLAGEAPGSFAIDDRACNAPLPAGRACIVEVTFATRSVGSQRAVLRAYGSNTAETALVGTGLVPLTVRFTGGGAASVSGDDGAFRCDTSAGLCTAEVDHSPVTLRLEPADDAVFVGWSVPGCSSTSCDVELPVGEVEIRVIPREQAVTVTRLDDAFREYEVIDGDLVHRLSDRFNGAIAWKRVGTGRVVLRTTELAGARVLNGSGGRYALRAASAPDGSFHWVGGYQGLESDPEIYQLSVDGRLVALGAGESATGETVALRQVTYGFTATTEAQPVAEEPFVRLDQTLRFRAGELRLEMTRTMLATATISSEYPMHVAVPGACSAEGTLGFDAVAIGMLLLTGQGCGSVDGPQVGGGIAATTLRWSSPSSIVTIEAESETPHQTIVSSRDDDVIIGYQQLHGGAIVTLAAGDEVTVGHTVRIDPRLVE